MENFKQFSLKMLRCEARAFPVCTAYRYMVSRPFFTPHGRDVHCEIDYWPLAVSMPPTKVCPLSFDPNINYETYESSEIS